VLDDDVDPAAKASAQRLRLELEQERLKTEALERRLAAMERHRHVD
jgi:hypothetical protein